MHSHLILLCMHLLGLAQTCCPRICTIHSLLSPLETISHYIMTTIRVQYFTAHLAYALDTTRCEPAYRTNDPPTGPAHAHSHHVRQEFFFFFKCLNHARLVCQRATRI
ncbi:hypothetical protein CPB86DRAFT_605165 [Serendipita vermifera]|nr:hypothetical protein CPB86DRAFT_605165 [Serendipita vermifera]